MNVSPLTDGKHTLTFSNGNTVQVDMVVGADGAWSRVRPLVTSVQPVYSGVTFIEVHITLLLLNL